jgi:DNA primase
VDPERQTFKCFGCGAGGDVFKFIQLRENVNFKEARKILATKAGLNLIESDSKPARPGEAGKVDLERVNRWACRWFAEQLASAGGHRAREYLSERGISGDSVRLFSIGHAPDGWTGLYEDAMRAGFSVELLLAAGLIKQRDDGGRPYDAFRNRIIFPILDSLERVIGFGGRTLGDDPAKYINSPQSYLFNKSRCLYGIATAKHAFRDAGRAVVVEGYVDCIMAQQHGFGETVATLGTALTLDHVQMLRRYVSEVVLLFDSDSAGQRAMNQCLPLFLTTPLSVKVAQVPEGKDPADLLTAHGPKPLRLALTSAVGALESKWKQVLRECRDDARGPDMRRAIEEFLGLIGQSIRSGVCDPIQRGLLVNQVGKLLGLSSEEVQRHLRTLARQQGPASASAADSMPPARNAAAAAMQELLEVLICEPGYFESVRGQFEPAICGDPELSQIAATVVELASRQGGFTLPELISRFESVQVARRIMDLHFASEQGGNYAARVEGAVARLHAVRDRERIGSVLAEHRRIVPGPAERERMEEGDAATSADVQSEYEVKLRAAAEAARRMRHFAARRHVTATPPYKGAASGVPLSAD